MKEIIICIGLNNDNKDKIKSIMVKKLPSTRKKYKEIKFIKLKKI